MINIQYSKTIYDLFNKLDINTPVFPGDPSVKIESICSIENESYFTLRHLHFGNHTGTHIDFPAHVIKNGKTSSYFPINHLFGSGIIIECDKGIQGRITKDFLQKQSMIKEDDLVFFKDASYLEIEAAEFLIDKKVRIIGVDSLSVDDLNDETLPIHNLLLKNDILLVENLNLNNIIAGRGEILIAPLNFSNIDGVPARVILWK